MHKCREHLRCQREGLAALRHRGMQPGPGGRVAGAFQQFDLNQKGGVNAVDHARESITSFRRSWRPVQGSSTTPTEAVS